MDKERFYIAFPTVKHQRRFSEPLMPPGGQQDTLTKQDPHIYDLNSIITNHTQNWGNVGWKS